MSHVTYQWVMSRMNESCHVWMSHFSYEWVISRMNESCHVWMSHVTYEWVVSRMNESCLIWMSHVSYKWVMSHMIVSCLTWTSHLLYEWVTSHISLSCAVRVCAYTRVNARLLKELVIFFKISTISLSLNLIFLVAIWSIKRLDLLFFYDSIHWVLMSLYDSILKKQKFLVVYYV